MSSMPPRTARDLTRVVREIEQRLPPKRRRPSLPQVSMERADGKEAAARAKARLHEQANPQPVTIPERREVFEEPTHVGAGANRTREPRTRALTTVEKAYNAGSLTWEEYAAAGVLRNRFIAQLGGSEGVAAYGEPRGSGPPWNKADRKAVMVLDRNRKSTQELADLLFSMVGVVDEKGVKVFDPQLAELLLRAVTETVDAVRLGDIGAQRTEYGGEKQRQAAGGAILRECLRRGAAHLSYIRAQQWRDATSWRVIDNPAK